MSDEVLRLRGVAVSYEKSMLLRDVDWTVRSDESWVVIGPNGAGKTTLLQVAAAHAGPDRRAASRSSARRSSDADLIDLRTRIGLASVGAWPTGCRPRRRSSTWC